jgi:tyrosine-protein phosphatase
MGLCEIIDNRTKEGKKVLVHCQQGASRSASLIIAYGLYKDPSLTVNDAYHAAQAKSKWISPNMKLMYALQDFQKEVEKKKLLSAAGHKRGGGRSPTKHRITLSADAVEFSPKDPPLTAPLPDRDGNSPAGNTPLRLRGNSTPNFGEVSPGPSSAPSSFAWTPKAEKAPAQFGSWGSFPPELSEPQSAVTQTDFGFSQSTFGFSQSTFSEAGPRSFNHGGFGSFPQPSYDTPPDSGFSSQTDQPQGTAFNAFPSLSAAGNQRRDIGLTLQNIATFPTQFAVKTVDDTSSEPLLWSPRVQEFTANPLRHSFAPVRPLDNGPPSPAIMSPRVTEFVNPFRPAPTTNFSRPLNTRPAVLRPVVDPRSPAMKGEAPIIRSIDDVL